MADISIFHMKLGKNRLLRKGLTKVITVQEPFLFPHKISKSILPIFYKVGAQPQALSS